MSRNNHTPSKKVRLNGVNYGSLTEAALTQNFRRTDLSNRIRDKKLKPNQEGYIVLKMPLHLRISDPKNKSRKPKFSTKSRKSNENLQKKVSGIDKKGDSSKRRNKIQTHKRK